MEIVISDNRIRFMREGEIGVIEACGKGCIRFRATASMHLPEENWTLMPGCDEDARAWREDGATYLTSGSLTCRLADNGALSFLKGDKVILKEQPEFTFEYGFRNYRSVGSNLWKASVTFEPCEEEQFYGLGHERINAFSKKGCTVDLVHLNTKCSMPYVYSSLGYGFLWNQPSTGRVELANNRTRWTSDCTKGLDFVVIEGAPKEVCKKLSDLTGYAPNMPEWALGFWQSKLRYETQDQLLSAARKYKEMGVPISVIIVDFFHWTEQGDYRFDPVYWPDPKAMADELHEMGIKLVVSMWPTINEHSENYKYLLDHNMLLRTASGTNRVFNFYGPQAEIDPTNPEAREYIWNRLKENYIDIGVDQLWFDEAEPEMNPVHMDNVILYGGRGDEVGLLFPYYYEQLVYDGMHAIGRDEVVTLSRCAYLGAQKFGAVVWSGDVKSTFESLTEQVKSGLNMAMCGIPWWNTDIGGFYAGDIKTDYFRELIVRWFQYGVFCPIMRLHGNRVNADRNRDIKEPSGADNEIWSFGERNTPILKDLIELRYRLIPYIKAQMDKASAEGTPVMRPMFMHFPEDSECYKAGDQYFFGDDILFAPITVQGQTVRRVYLPEGRWVLTSDRKVYEGGRYAEIEAPIDSFIAFVAEGAEVLDVF